MDRLFFLVKLSVFLITITINNGNFSQGFKLSNVCRIEDTYDKYKMIVCKSLKKSLDMSENEIANYKKKNNMTQSTNLYYKLSSPEILDNSQNFSTINNALRKTIELNTDSENIGILIKYSNLKGLDLNTTFSIDDNLYPSIYNVHYRFEIHDSIFQFFLNNQLQISCEDYLKWNLSQPKSLLQVASETSQIDFHVEYVKYSPKPICPLYFKNVQLRTINFYYQINTYYKKSYLTFSTIKNNDVSFLNTKIFQLNTYYNEKIDIDSNSFLNKYVFHDVKILGIFGEINSIEKDIFKSFEQLKVISFDMMFFGQLSRKGTEWISSINFDLNVNMSNKLELEFNINHTKIIFLNLFVGSNVDRDSINVFQDEDFCLFKDYPFNQLVVFYMKYWKELFVTKYSCTVQWILKTIRLYMKYPNMQLRFYMDGTYSDFLGSNISRFEKCDFDKMLENCNKMSFKTKNEWTINDTKETTIVIEFIFILLQPIVCFIGLLFNLLIIYTLSIGDNKKNLTAVHYSYLKMASISNMVVLLIGILSPIFECQQRQGIYCPSFHKLVFSQYFKIIIGEFVCSVFKLLSNFFYVGFSICRLSLIGKDHSKLTKFVSEISIFYYIFVSLIISVCLSVVKIFRYQVNNFNPTEEYPIILVVEQIIELHQDVTIKPRLVKIFNGVADLTTYFLFIPINFILDLVLILDLKKTLSDKQNLDAAKKTMILFRVKFLVVAFVLFNILMKLPTTFKSIFDLVNLFNLSSPIAKSRKDNIYDQYCVYARFCPAFEKFASILFIVSISVNIFFYYLFDKNFKSGINIALSKLTSSEKSHLEYVEALEKINKSN